MIGSRKTAATVVVDGGAQRRDVAVGNEFDTPGVIGSNGARLAGWPVSASAPIVRPWNAPSAAMIRGRPVSRAILNAASLASAPELQKITRPSRGAEQLPAAARPARARSGG